MWRDVGETGKRRSGTVEGESSREAGGVDLMAEVILTIGHTLILDLQVFVGPWAGVREDIWTRDHNTLGPIVASGRGETKRRNFNLATKINQSILIKANGEREKKIYKQRNKIEWSCYYMAKINSPLVIKSGSCPVLSRNCSRPLCILIFRLCLWH